MGKIFRLIDYDYTLSVCSASAAKLTFSKIVYFHRQERLRHEGSALPMKVATVLIQYVTMKKIETVYPCSVAVSR